MKSSRLNNLIWLALLLNMWGCHQDKHVDKDAPSNIMAPKLDKEAAKNLSSLPMSCIQKEYPNKLGQVLGDDSYLKPPKVLHPAFYGCFDWHSAVHGHWSLVSLLKQYPDIEKGLEIKNILLQNISQDNILKEVAYFKDTHNASYERTYGWAWLLKLAEEIHTWDDELAPSLSKNLQPLVDLIVTKYKEFLPKLVYPIRVGEHSNTAFGLSFALDYAMTVGDTTLMNIIVNRSKDFYMSDIDCPLSWEPSGYDFLSPCLEEARLMSKVLSSEKYRDWIYKFMPQLLEPQFTLNVGNVSDRTDGKLVHLDGLNFSRAWCLLEISNTLGGENNMTNIAYQHINHSLPNLIGDSYEGGHWLGSFAIYALNQTDHD